MTVLVYPSDNPYEFVDRPRDRDRATDGDDDAHIDRLAKKYINQDTYPFRQPGERPGQVRDLTGPRALHEAG